VIDFRYHVVSIVAVFLALAVGIVVGSGPLKDDISGFLEDRTEQLAQEKVDLQSEVSDLRNEVEYNQRIAEVSQPVLLDQLLPGHVTTVLVLPDADGDQVKAVEDAIGAAGGQVGERVTIEPSWGDPDQTDLLGRVAEDITKGGRDEDPYTLASQALADALLTPGGRAVGQESSDSTFVLSSFESQGFITADESQSVRADTAIVVGPEGAVPNANRYVVPLVSALDEFGLGTVLTAPAGSDDSAGVIGVLRDSDSDGVV
jgi:hypothetical protein